MGGQLESGLDNDDERAILGGLRNDMWRFMQIADPIME